MKIYFLTLKTSIILSVAVFVFVIFFAGIGNVYAATFFLSCDKTSFAIGDAFDVNIKIDTEDAGINTAQATIQFPRDMLEVKNIDKSNSIFNFWLEDPVFSNDNGRIAFIGGSNLGSSGKSLQVLKIGFAVKGTGQSDLVFVDGAITASDGSGTNVLSTMRGLKLTSVAKTETEEIAPPVVPPPTQIIRPPAPAEKLPAKPSINVPLYPDFEKWYNTADNFIVQWDLPLDISDVSTALDQNISYTGQKSEGLFESKVFPVITQDGVWYLHVRFKNNIGWGPSINYPIYIDTAPPLAFDVKIVEGDETNTPDPTLQFSASDALSGIKEYHIRIGNGEVMKLPIADFNGTFKLPLQSPGEKTIWVEANDFSGNSAEKLIKINILPISSPVITFVTRKIYIEGEGGLSIKGMSLPGVSVLLSIIREKELVAEAMAHADESGNWNYVFEQPLRMGKYTITAQSKDARGALSLAVASKSVEVKEKPIFQLWIFELSKTNAAAFLVIFIVVGFGGGWQWYKKRRKTVALRVLIAENDLTKVFNIIKEDISKLNKARLTETQADDEFTIKRLNENIKRLEGYLKEGVKKIKM